MAEEADTSTAFPKDLILNIAVAIIVIGFVIATFYYTGIGKTLFLFMAEMILRASDYTGVFSGFLRGILGGIGSTLPFG